MKVIEPGYEILTKISSYASNLQIIPGVNIYKIDPEKNAFDELRHIEEVARTCYKSEDKISGNDISSAKKLIKMLISKGHEAMLEHSTLSVKFICSRAISHEMVRHRLASFAQESQRYCNYSNDKFDSEITFIRPLWVGGNPDVRTFVEGKRIDIATDDTIRWYELCKEAENAYFDLLDYGLLPQEAREVLPNSTKTEVVVTANYREWRHILKLRTAPDAHPEMQRIMKPLLEELKYRIPVVFDDI